MADKDKPKLIYQCFAPVGELVVLYCAEFDLNMVLVPYVVNDGKGMLGNSQIAGFTHKWIIMNAWSEYEDRITGQLEHKCLGTIEIFGTIVTRKVLKPAWFEERKNEKPSVIV